MDSVYSFDYYQCHCGPIPYDVPGPWMEYFGNVADQIIKRFQPKKVLDVGCAMGHLVSALRDRGVEAYGMDISEYAISKVREDIRPFCVVGSLLKPLPKGLPQSYDLITCIEILEHLYEKDAVKAVENLCKLSECIFFSSSSTDFAEPTHFNIRQHEYWSKLFRKFGFARDLMFEATWCSADSMLFRKCTEETLEDVVFRYEHHTRLLKGEIKALQDRYGTTTQILTVQIDSGKGYEEKERIYSCHTPNQPYINIGITVPAGGKTIRIEPVKGYASLITDVVVQPCEPNSSIRLKRHNGYQVRNSFLFETTEPELIYELSGKTPVVYQIIATVTVFPSMSVARELKALLEALSEEHQEFAKRQELNLRELCANAEQSKVHLQEQLLRERQEAETKSAQLREQITRERQEAETKSAQLREQMTRECEQMRQRHTQIQRQLTEVQIRSEKQEKLCETLKEENIRTENEAAYYKKQERRLRAELAQSEEKLLELSQKARTLKTTEDQLAHIELERNSYAARLATMEQQMRVTMEHLNHTREALECIQNSNCWRITAPLRRFLDWCKGNSHVVQQASIPPLVTQPAQLHDAVIMPFCDPEVNVKPVITTLPAMNTTTDPADMLPESLFHNRKRITNLVDRFSQYDVVSFDIFDTLIFRVFDIPTDVFRLMGHRLGEEGFAKLRIQAEQKARERYTDENGEVNIHEIYEVLSEYLAIDAEYVLNQEFQAEKDCCYANPYLKRVFDELIKRKQKVILVSDMYWPKHYLNELLKSCGYAGYADIYVSCDYRCGKGTGNLQKIAAMNYPEAESFIHIGDNRISDIECSAQMGWDTWFYQSCHELGDSLRPHGMDRLSASVYRSIVNAHLHADEAVYSPEYEHGFRYAGFLVCGFCEWLNEYVEKNNIDKIFFLARDADILYKIYNKYYRKVDNEYVVTSRLAMWEMAFEANPEEFIQNFFWTRANMGTQTLADALEETDLEFLVPLLNRTDLSGEDLLTCEHYERFHTFIMDHYLDIVSHFAPSKRAGQQYFKRNIGNAKNICAVDIGWSGQILITMRKLFKEMYGDEVSLRGAYMAVTGNEATSGYVESNIITAYLFHGCMNQKIAINTATPEGDMCAKFIEATFTSDQCTLLKYEYSELGDVNMKYGMRTTEIGQVREIQSGIMAFVEQWQKQTKILRPHLQIMPSDAKIILDSGITNFRYCYAVFGNNLEWNMPLPNYKGQGTITTLGAMLKDRGFV